MFYGLCNILRNRIGGATIIVSRNGIQFYMHLIFDCITLTATDLRLEVFQHVFCCTIFVIFQTACSRNAMYGCVRQLMIRKHFSQIQSLETMSWHKLQGNDCGLMVIILLSVQKAEEPKCNVKGAVITMGGPYACYLAVGTCK